jgi:hypothetical protein
MKASCCGAIKGTTVVCAGAPDSAPAQFSALPFGAPSAGTPAGSTMRIFMGFSCE